ncbi:hypothetical protein WMF18_01280 [Sorangium sp. So ce315]
MKPLERAENPTAKAPRTPRREQDLGVFGALAVHSRSIDVIGILELLASLPAALLLGRLLASHMAASVLAILRAMLLAALLLGRLRAMLLAALLLGRLRAMLLAALLLGGLRAMLLAALLLGGLRAMLLAVLLLGGLRAMLLAALLLGGLRAMLLAALLLGRLRAMLLAVLLLGRLRAMLLARLRAVLLGALLRAPLLVALLLAGLLLLPLLQRAEDLLGVAQVPLDVRPHLDDLRPEVRVLHALDEPLVEDLEGAAVQRDLGPHERRVELGAFLLLQRFAGLDRAGLELLALRAGLEADPGAPRQPGPVLLRPGVLVDHLLRIALHVGGIGLLQRDLRQRDLLLIDERDQRRYLLPGRLLHRAVAAGLSTAALLSALEAGLSAPSAALEAGLIAARLLLTRALTAALPAALLALPVALEAGPFAAALSSACATACAARAITACLAAAPAVSARVFTGVALTAGRGLAVRLGLIVSTGDAPASPRECKAPREHDRREAT